jgi:hypothetical protein
MSRAATSRTVRTVSDFVALLRFGRSAQRGVLHCVRLIPARSIPEHARAISRACLTFSR